MWKDTGSESQTEQSSSVVASTDNGIGGDAINENGSVTTGDGATDVSTSSTSSNVSGTNVSAIAPVTEASATVVSKEQAKITELLSIAIKLIFEIDNNISISAGTSITRSGRSEKSGDPGTNPEELVIAMEGVHPEAEIWDSLFLSAEGRAAFLRELDARRGVDEGGLLQKGFEGMTRAMEVRP